MCGEQTGKGLFPIFFVFFYKKGECSIRQEEFSCYNLPNS